MTIFNVFAIFITVAALAGYINYRYVKLPSAVVAFSEMKPA